MGLSLGVIGSALGGMIPGGTGFQYDAASDAAKAQEQAAREGIAAQTAARGEARELAQPFIDIGLGAGEQLQALLDQPQPSTAQSLEEINPVMDILRKQGFEQIQESAAAQGRLGAGGTLKDLTRFNTDLATTVAPQLQQQHMQQQAALQNQRFNQLFNVLGLGQNAAAGQGSAALQTGANIANLQGNLGQATAQGEIGKSNAITSGFQNVMSLVGAGSGGGSPFGGGGVTPSFAPTPTPFQGSQFSTGTSLTPQNILGTF